MKTKKIFVFLLAACLLLASCSPKNDKDPTDTDASDNKETTSAISKIILYDEPDINDKLVLHSSLYEYDLTQYVDKVQYSLLSISNEFVENQVNNDIEDFLLECGTRVEFEDDHVIETGDFAEIYYTGKPHDSSVTLSEVTLAGMTNASEENGYDLLIGSNNFITAYTSESEPEKNNPGFEDQLIGHRKGDEFTVTVTFPDYYSSIELEGLVVDFDVTVVAVKKISETELTEELVKNNTVYQSAEEYRNELYKYYLRHDAYDGISKTAEIKDLPDELNDPDYVLIEYLFKDLGLEITQGKYEEMVSDHYSQYSDIYYYYGISTIDEFVNEFGKDTLLLNFERELVMDRLAEIVTVK